MGLTPLLAFQLPEHDERVTDAADMLSDIEEQSLESTLQKIEKETAVEIAIVLLETHGGHDMNQLATKIGQDR